MQQLIAASAAIDCCIWLFDAFECVKMHGLTNRTDFIVFVILVIFITVAQ
jgi:hypothetical protein